MKGNVYLYQKCYLDCIELGYKQKTIDKSDSTLADTELAFNIVIDNHCCCRAKPLLTAEWYELPNDSESEDEDGATDGELSWEDNSKGKQKAEISDDDDDIEVEVSVTDDEDSLTKNVMETSSGGKRPWDSDIVEYEDELDETLDPKRESSKRTKFSNNQSGEDSP